MPYNGSGSFSPPAANYPAVSNTLITAANRNGIDADFATGLSTAITKDGQTTVTANIPFNGFRLLNIGNPSLATDAVNLRSIQNASGTYVATVGGTANAITLTPNPAISAYAAGQEFNFIVGTTNTAAVTIANSGLAVRNLKKRTSGGLVALVANDLIATCEYKIYDDGTQYVLEGSRPYSQGANIASASTINLDTATGDYSHITGTTSITAITLAQGEERTTVTDGILTFTNGASLIMLGGTDRVSAAGDVQKWRGEASGVVRNIGYFPATSAQSVTSKQTANTVFAGPTSGATAAPAFRALVPSDLSMTPITASLGADVALNNTANYFDGPSISQGAAGTWFVSGTITVLDTSSGSQTFAKLWDGTTIIASAAQYQSGVGLPYIIALSGYITSPVGNLRISAKNVSTTSGKITFNTSGNSKDSTITAIRIA